MQTSQKRNICDPWIDRPAAPNTYWKYSPLLGVTQTIVVLFWHISLNEWIKHFAIARAVKKRKNGDDCALYRSRAIDFYEILKWGILIVFICWPGSGEWSVVSVVVGYLLWSNLFGHFYYHVWDDRIVEYDRTQVSKDRFDVRRNRRLNSFIGAFAYMVIGYAYIYHGPLAFELIWTEGDISWKNAIFVSIANSFTLTYGDYGPCSGLARAVFASQVLYTFVFVGVIITRSIPSEGEQIEIRKEISAHGEKLSDIGKSLQLLSKEKKNEEGRE